MSFLHPEFFWLLPLVAAPLIIHLLTRLRYRRVRWAAIDFLLNNETKAVRRARLQQILLMILRTLILAAALMVLLEPILRGGIGRLLGSGNKMVILLDGSASMSSTTAGGTCFERGKRAALNAIAMFPRGTAAAFGLMAGECRISSREPLRDLRAVSNAIETARLTDGAADIPQAITAAAETLQRSGGGGVIWILTDTQASDWRPSDSGAWEATRKALELAGKPEIVVTPLERSTGVNFSFAGLSLSPPIPTEGDAPRLTATVQLNAERRTGGAESASEPTSALANVSLYFDGERVDSASVNFHEAGRADCVFNLPTLKAGAHSGYVQLDPDVIPADNRFYFTLSTEDQVPVLVVEGAPAGRPDKAASHFVSLALRPTEAEAGYRSPFLPKVVEADALSDMLLQPFEAVFLTDVPSLSDAVRQRLDEYVQAGGLLVIFPGEHTVPAEWTADKFPRIPLQGFRDFPTDKRAKVNWASQQNPLTQTLPLEGLNRLLISRLFPIEPPPASTEKLAAQVLMSTDSGQPFLVVQQTGKGRVFLFAVSAQVDFSNLPLTPFFPPTVHRLVLNHLIEKGITASHRAFMPLIVPALAEWPRIVTPDGRVEPLAPMKSDPDKASFEDTGIAGFYRLTAAPAGSVPPKDEGGPIVGTINVPPEESDMELIPQAVMGNLLQGFRVTAMAANGDLAATGHEASAGTWSFPFAIMALCAILGAVILAWAIDRPTPAKPAEAAAGGSRR
ncbi:MAG: BatA and WFA domain-containing protein [Candidatus Brocadiia bacterium]|jgi:hypothetical protein